MRVTRRFLLLLTHTGALLPLVSLLWDWYIDNLGADPIQEITQRTGKPALVLLVLSLACAPIYTFLGFRQMLWTRKWLGLYAFFYVCLHFMVFIGLDYGFDLELLREAIFEKRYALVGFGAGVILFPLALTSTRGWKRRLGKKWIRLHRLVYLAAILAVVHYIWLVKSDIRVPLLYGAIVLLLIAIRVPFIRGAVNRLRNPLRGGRLKG